MTVTKPIPKSLHTVTALVKLARLRDELTGGKFDRFANVEWAVQLLGYENTPDDHNLAAQACRQLQKDA